MKSNALTATPPRSFKKKPSNVVNINKEPILQKNHSYPFGIVKIINFGEIIPDAFLYKFTHIPTGKWYIGYHGLKENESVFDGAYWNSSTDEEFLSLLETHPKDFQYEILDVGSINDMLSLENAMLTDLKAAKDPMSWNKTNGIFMKTPELPRIDLVNQLAKDAYNINSDLERVEDVAISDILENLIRLQVRFTTEKSSTKISDYSNEMKSNNSTKGFTITILRCKDGQKVLIGGNHTLEAAKRSKMKYITVVYIDVELSEDEMYALGNALNRKDKPQRLTTEMLDVANQLVKMFKDKKIKDFKSQYCTNYIKLTGGFKGKEITKVRNLAVEYLQKDILMKNGKKWADYTSKRPIDYVKKKKEIANSLMSDTVLCLTQSSTFRTDRVIEEWIKDTKTRKNLKLKPRNEIKILMHYPDPESKNLYKINDEEGHRFILETFLKGAGVEFPKVTFDNESLEPYEDMVS